MRFTTLPLFTPLFMIACGGDEAPVNESVLVELDGAAAVAVDIVPASGAGSVAIPVRTINQFGAAVPGGEVTVTLAGTGLSKSGEALAASSWGTTFVNVQSNSNTAIDVAVSEWSEGESDATGLAHITNSNLDGYELLDAFPVINPPEHLMPSRGGYAYSDGPRVMWQPDELGAAPYIAVELSGEVRGLAKIDLDNDGPEEIIAISAAEVVALRLSAEYGPVWGAGFETTEGQITGVTVGDFNRDSANDIFITLDLDNHGQAELLLGDGLGGLTAVEPLYFDDIPTSASFGDFTGTGDGEVALLFEGYVTRFIYAGREDLPWMNTGQNLSPNPALLEGSTLSNSEDLNGDGIHEIIAADPEVDSGERRIVFYTIDNTVTIRDKSYEAFHHSVDDITGDGLADIVILRDTSDGGTELRAITTDSTDERDFLDRSYASIPMNGEVALTNADGNNVADVVIANNAVRLYPGEIPEAGSWTVRDDAMVSYNMASTGLLEVFDADEQGWKNLFSSKLVNGELWLYTYTFQNGPDGSVFDLVANNSGLEIIDNADANANAEIVDSRFCPDDDRLYILVEDGGRYVYSIRVLASSNTELKGYKAVNGDIIACGDFANGEDMAVISHDGTVTWFDANLGNRGTGPEQLGEVTDAVAYDPDGNGDVLTYCRGNCSIDAADLDGDGIDEVAVGGEDPHFDGWGDSVTLAAGSPEFRDTDGDDELDLVMSDPETGLVTIYRSIDSSLSNPTALHSRQILEGRAMFADVDNNGTMEILFAGTSGIMLMAER